LAYFYGAWCIIVLAFLAHRGSGAHRISIRRENSRTKVDIEVAGNDELVWCSSSQRQEESKLIEEDRERL